VQALIDLSDSTQMPIYLESSPGSYGLYKKMGFQRVPEHVARVVHEAEVLGTEKDVEVPLMIRLPMALTATAVNDGGKSVEDVYREWYAQNGLGEGGHGDGSGEKVKIV
jgi:hypothetical protein